MKLFYLKTLNNFGDAINPLIWHQILPDFFDLDANVLFVGVGSLLNYSIIPQESYKIIFGTGSMGIHVPVIDASWHFYCVRGPLTAQALGLEPEQGIVDPAILVRKFDLSAEPKLYHVSIMPHHASFKFWDWQSIADEAGIHLIDPRANISDVLRDIQRSELLLAEAMHGAIVADALRVPWIPLRNYRHINAFKWQDWCKSIGLEYNPVQLPHLYGPGAISGKAAQLLRFANLSHNGVAQFASRVVQAGVNALFQLVNHAVIKRKVIAELQAIVKTTPPNLSKEDVMRSLEQRLEAKIENFKADCKLGYFERIPTMP